MAERWHSVANENAVTAPRTVLVVDDYEPFRRFVSATLGRTPRFLILGEARDGLEAIQQADVLQPDLILLDIGLPKVNGLEAARKIREIAHEARIVFVTQESSPEIVQEALDLGASGYVVKVQAGNELVRALEMALLGRTFLSDGLQRRSSGKGRTA